MTNHKTKLLTAAVAAALSTTAVTTATAQPGQFSAKQVKAAESALKNGGIKIRLTTNKGWKTIRVSPNSDLSQLAKLDLSTASKVRVLLPGVKDPQLKLGAAANQATRRAAPNLPQATLGYGELLMPPSIFIFQPFAINFVRVAGYGNCPIRISSHVAEANSVRKNFGSWKSLTNIDPSALTSAPAMICSTKQPHPPTSGSAWVADWGIFQFDVRYSDQLQDGTPTASFWVLSLPILN